MTTMSVLPVQTYAAGTYNIPATFISDVVTQIGIAVQRCTSSDPTIWPNSSDTISFELDLSTDGGLTYQPWASGSDSGGIVKNRLGVEIPTMNIQGTLTAGTNRFIRGTVTLSAAIKTGASVTVI